MPIPAITLLALGAVSTADYMSGGEISLLFLYVAIAAFVARNCRNDKVVLATALVCAVVPLIIRWTGFDTGSPAIGFWNVCSAIALPVMVALVVLRLSRALDAEKTAARTDFLTGAPNTRALFEMLAARVERAHRLHHPLAVACIDIDNFKVINDRLGHQQGDDVLRDVARALATYLRKTDSVARVGGDEFLVCLPDTDRREAEAVMIKIRRHLRLATQRYPLPVTFSIGIATYPSPPQSIDVLIRAADAMMYEAKSGGKNCIRGDFFSDADEPQPLARANGPRPRRLGGLGDKTSATWRLAQR